MSTRISQNLKVGLLVLTGSFFFLAALYLIGSKDNLFTPGFKIYAKFSDVKGLLVGNNIRFSGINIGTVKQLIIENDSTVKVVMNIQEDARKFIKKNTKASIGTDGLIGNKIIILTSSTESSDIVKNGDEILTVSAFDTDANLKNLEDIGAEVAIVAKNLKEITDKLNRSDVVWDLLADSSMGVELRSTFAYLNKIGANGAALTKDFSIIVKEARYGKGNLAVLLNDSTLAGFAADLRNIMADIKSGKGTLGTLISDEKSAENIQSTLSNIKLLSDSLAYVSSELTHFSKSMRQGAESINSTVSDTVFLDNLNRTMQHISNSAVKLEENLEALKHSFLLKGYFRRQEKKKSKLTNKVSLQSKSLSDK